MLWLQFGGPQSGVSYNHFWRRFRDRWANVLRFSPESSHAGCSDCLWFKEDLQSRFEVAKMYREHLNSVAKDRELEEYLQECCFSDNLK
ncbi:unnamed protein product [Symbiodinium sp. CCMP2592]|nr:unnamed protein product [Symbiodinium sp. CCMP2592]